MAKRRKAKKSLKGAARSAAKAPKACRVALGKCMTGKASKAKASKCMKAFHRCKA